MGKSGETDTKKYFLTQLENTSIQLLIADVAKKTVNVNPVFHSHQGAEIFACKEGTIEIQTANKLIVLSANDLIIIPPGVPHRRAKMQFETSGYSFSFNIHKKERSLATDLYKELTPFITEDRIFIYRNQPTAVEKAEKIALDSNRVPKFYPGMWLVQLLMELLAAQIETEEADTFQRQKASKANDIQFTMEIENLIAANYDKDYNITKMAGQLHISTRQLDRIIRKHYGKTLHEIFMEMRVEAAQYYLLNTKMSVDKIAVTVGFNSSVGLYREFKKKHGITPSEYKKRRTS